MQNYSVLHYARCRKRSVARVVITGAVCALLVGLAAWRLGQVWQRMVRLNNDASFGPVDWPSVVRSRKLVQAAWALSSSPAGALPSRLEVFDVLTDYSDSISIDLKLPITYVDGRAHFAIVVKNSGQKSIVVPPFVTLGDARRRACHSRPEVYILPGPYLGKGVKALGPRESFTLSVSVPADPRPRNVLIIFIYDLGHTFAVHSGTVDSRGRRIATGGWEDIQEAAVTHEVSSVPGQRRPAHLRGNAE